MSTTTIRPGTRRARPGKAASKTELRPEPDADLEAKTRPLSFDLVRWIFGYTRPHAFKRNLLVGLTVVRAIQLPVLAWMLGWVIEGPIRHGSTSSLFGGVAALFAMAMFTHLTYHFRQRLALELGEAVIHDLRNDLFSHLQRMPMRFFNETKLGRLISRVSSDADSVRAGVQDVLFCGVVAMGQMCVAALLMFVADPVLFLIVAAMGPGIWAINVYFRKRLSVAYRNVQESFSRVTSTVAESIQGVHVIQGSVREKAKSDDFRELVTDHAEYNMQVARGAGAFLPVLEINSQCFLAGLLVIGGYRVLNPALEMPLGSLLQFLFLANIFFGPIQSLGDLYNQTLAAMAGAERVRRLLETEPESMDSPGAKPLAELRGHVRFENVSFGYDPERPVLHRVSFTAEPGQMVALVGHTGSGKSTIVNLIAKFYQPCRGRILLDGHDLRDVQSDWLHRRMGIVLQQNFLFTGTVMENIRRGRPDATDAEVIDAVEQLGCLDLLDSLPDGLHTEVGESGCRLSLGQRQLVCFARAMLADPQILLLDEATSSIDVITEHRLQEALSRLLVGRTSFVVAHRLSTIRNADLVLVLDQGEIVERGEHAQLVAHGGAYASLHRHALTASAA